MSGYKVRVDGHEVDVDLLTRKENFVSFSVNGEIFNLTIEPNIKHESRNSSAAPFQNVLSTLPSSAVVAAPGEIIAQMPGIIVRLLVAEGDQVAIGQSLLTIEAMKMENNISATKSGKVAKICVAAGQQVKIHQTLLSIE